MPKRSGCALRAAARVSARPARTAWWRPWWTSAGACRPIPECRWQLLYQVTKSATSRRLPLRRPPRHRPTRPRPHADQRRRDPAAQPAQPAHLAERARIRDARPAGPAPTPAPVPIRVERRVSCRGTLVIAGQRIHIGIAHAGAPLTVEAADTTFRNIHDGDQLLTEVPRTTTKPIALFKARKPEPARRTPTAQPPVEA